MFTGIVSARGTVRALEKTDDGSAKLILDIGSQAAGLALGGSIAVDGVCLTATSIDSSTQSAQSDTATSHQAEANGVISIDVMGETLLRSTIGLRRSGDQVNLERCVAAGERFDGHVVQGHVDGVGALLEREDQGEWQRLRFSVPTPLARYIAEKGSIAIDGVSLTVTAVSAPQLDEQWFEVGLIPTTLEHTGLGSKSIGEAVNLEVDVLAKYTERLLAFGGPAAVVVGTEEIVTTSADTGV
ncbi:riboflavin synthase [Psychromicrobium lacuslunae]|uniref:riboflavin synthase n=1 Tax=Psychromicrobium lacuslunae TaxID=1618207 RepID=UPI0005D449A0|nr:riboflavin synthase [Psychromicrobium lacuslunae]